jgi:hypothetical protein
MPKGFKPAGAPALRLPSPAPAPAPAPAPGNFPEAMLRLLFQSCLALLPSAIITNCTLAKYELVSHTMRVVSSGHPYPNPMPMPAGGPPPMMVSLLHQIPCSCVGRYPCLTLCCRIFFDHGPYMSPYPPCPCLRLQCMDGAHTQPYRRTIDGMLFLCFNCMQFCSLCWLKSWKVCMHPWYCLVLLKNLLRMLLTVCMWVLHLRPSFNRKCRVRHLRPSFHRKCNFPRLPHPPRCITHRSRCSTCRSRSRSRSRCSTCRSQCSRCSLSRSNMCSSPSRFERLQNTQGLCLCTKWVAWVA